MRFLPISMRCSKKGGPFKQGKDMRKEYQKLIDGVDYDAIQFFDIH